MRNRRNVKPSTLRLADNNAHNAVGEKVDHAKSIRQIDFFVNWMNVMSPVWC